MFLKHVDQLQKHVELPAGGVTSYLPSVLRAAPHTTSFVITESSSASVCVRVCVCVSGVLLFTVYLYHPICAMFGLHPSIVEMRLAPGGE